MADARKGVKNVLKNFWRKPREESPSRLGGNGTVRYRYDRIESQILLLADSCFIVKVRKEGGERRERSERESVRERLGGGEG